MRRILVEKAWQKLGSKRGGGRAEVKLDEALNVADLHAAEVLRVHRALDDLTDESPVKAELVNLRYFAGPSHQQAADAL